MKKKIYKFVKHPLISGSAIIFISSFIGNILNYIFNLGLGRLLSVSDYGIFAALISTINLFYVCSSAISTVFTKFSASFAGQKKEELISVLLQKGNLLVSVIGLLICGLILLFSPNIAFFLHVGNKNLIYFVALIIFITFLSSSVYGILQGLMKFIFYSFLTIFSAFVKLILGILFIFLGFRLFGALGAITISLFLTYLLALIPLRKFIFMRKDGLEIPNLYRRLFSYALPVFLSGLGMTMFISIDIILVKHFFSAVIAGQYAALSLMGRSIFYVIYPIIFVSFPLIAQKKEKKENLFEIILLSMILVGVPSIILSAIYFIFPQLILGIFFPSKAYSMLGPLLGPFSIVILFYSLAFVLNNYYLSIGKTNVFIITVSASILETIFMIFFHQNIQQIITVLICTSFLLLISLLLYYPYAKTEE